MSIATPSLVKFAHVFETHQHEVCTNFSTTHFHEFDIDCEFYKFKIPLQTQPQISSISVLEVINISNNLYNHYTLLQSLEFNLYEHRGPPLLM
ncbi:MAG: hypothetical protein HKO92_02085 [Flavobacteriaceae bacterium]|nr:hypothetical protein [Flavobacteriaceae bacterium]